MSKSTGWHPTKLYKPGLGSGTPVERTQLGYAKTGEIENEKIASDLAKLIPVPVPYVDIADLQGLGPCAISHVHALRCRPLASKGELLQREYSPNEKTALKRASCLLPFLAWIAANDHFDNTNLVVEEFGNDLCRIVAIDFEHAFSWAQNEEKIVPPTPPALVNNRDTLVVRESLEAIERLTAAQIEGCCEVLQDHPRWRDEIEGTLRYRQPLLRDVLAEQGWLD